MKKPVKAYLQEFVPECVQGAMRERGSRPFFGYAAQRRFFLRGEINGQVFKVTRPHNVGRRRGLDGTLR